MILRIDHFYPHLPVILQHAAVSAFGWKWMRRRYGGIFQTEYLQFRNREAFTLNEWHDYQTVKLRTLLLHAYDTVPHYNASFKASGIGRSKLQRFQLSDMPTLPFLTKEILRREAKRGLLSTNRERSGEFFASSGSTGTPTQILYSHAFHQRLSASYEARVRNWAGVNRFVPRAMIGGRRVISEGNAKPPFGRYNFFEKQLYLSAYHISRNTARDYLKQIQQFSSEYMVGYAMSQYFLARFFDELGLDAPEMKAVITSSEKLTPSMRSLFEKVYACKTFDGWSGVENCGLISETENNELLVSPDVGIVEVLKPDGTPAKPGEMGEVVCTGLLNFDQPLIRYKIGDQVVVRKDQVTKCGRNMAVIDEIVGRVEDVVVGKDGREMVRFHGIFVQLESVLQAQLIQEKVDEFLVKVIPTVRLTEADKITMTKRLNSQLGDVVVRFQEVTEIPSGPGGKFKAVISRVDRSTAHV